jgi:hypothetical protein
MGLHGAERRGINKPGFRIKKAAFLLFSAFRQPILNGYTTNGHFPAIPASNSLKAEVLKKPPASYKEPVHTQSSSRNRETLYQ